MNSRYWPSGITAKSWLSQPSVFPLHGFWTRNGRPLFDVRSAHMPLFTLTHCTMTPSFSIGQICHCWLVLPSAFVNRRGVPGVVLAPGTPIAVPHTRDVITALGKVSERPTWPLPWTHA